MIIIMVVVAAVGGGVLSPRRRTRLSCGRARGRGGGVRGRLSYPGRSIGRRPDVPPTCPYGRWAVRGWRAQQEEQLVHVLVGAVICARRGGTGGGVGLDGSCAHRDA